MALTKQIRDWTMKALQGPDTVPRVLYELEEYFAAHGPITFETEQADDGLIVARSVDFRYGSIITTGRSRQELDRNIKDAILTSFDVPSSYAKEASIAKTGKLKKRYAIAA